MSLNENRKKRYLLADAIGLVNVVIVDYADHLVTVVETEVVDKDYVADDAD